MKIFDCHVHIEDAKARYDLPGVARRNVIFNSVASYRANRRRVPAGNAVTLVLDPKNLKFVAAEAKAGRVDAFKIHSRIQRLDDRASASLLARLKTLKPAIPIIYDAFYYGENLKCQPSLPFLVDLATAFPKNAIVAAHSGGHHVLDYFFHLRPLKNIYYDLSFSLQALEDSSRLADLEKLIRWTDKGRILFGSDHSAASPRRQLKILSDIFRRLKISAKDREKILFGNAQRIFG